MIDCDAARFRRTTGYSQPPPWVFRYSAQEATRDKQNRGNKPSKGFQALLHYTNVLLHLALGTAIRPWQLSATTRFHRFFARLKTQDLHKSAGPCPCFLTRYPCLELSLLPFGRCCCCCSCSSIYLKAWTCKAMTNWTFGVMCEKAHDLHWDVAPSTTSPE